jgi:hypothetical protein
MAALAALAGHRATARSGAWTAQAGCTALLRRMARWSRRFARSLSERAFGIARTVRCGAGSPPFQRPQHRIAGACGGLESPLAKAIPARGVAQSLAVMHPWPATIKLPPRAHPLFSRPLLSYFNSPPSRPSRSFAACSLSAPSRTTLFPPPTTQSHPWWTLLGQPIDAFACSCPHYPRSPATQPAPCVPSRLTRYSGSSPLPILSHAPIDPLAACVCIPAWSAQEGAGHDASTLNRLPALVLTSPPIRTPPRLALPTSVNCWSRQIPLTIHICQSFPRGRRQSLLS